MKKIVVSLIFFALLFITNAFAVMQITNSTQPYHGVYFEGKIDYVNFDHHHTPTIVLDAFDENGDGVQVTFTEEDVPAGLAFINAIGTDLVIGIAENGITVTDIWTYNHHRLKANKFENKNKFPA